MDPNTHIYFINKLIIFYVLKFTVSKYKRRLHLRGVGDRSSASSCKSFSNCRESSGPPRGQDSKQSPSR